MNVLLHERGAIHLFGMLVILLLLGGATLVIVPGARQRALTELQRALGQGQEVITLEGTAVKVDITAVQTEGYGIVGVQDAVGTTHDVRVPFADIACAAHMDTPNDLQAGRQVEVGAVKDVQGRLTVCQKGTYFRVR